MLMAKHAVQPCPTVGRRAVVLQRGQQRFLRKVLGVVPISADAQRGAEQLVRVSLQAVCVHPPVPPLRVFSSYSRGKRRLIHRFLKKNGQFKPGVRKTVKQNL